jgi:thioredoxin 1
MSSLKNVLLFVQTAILMCFFLACTSRQKPDTKNETQGIKEPAFKVTFIELGSVRCIPCQKMQPVMKSIIEKYGTQVNVVFHDVWTEAGAPYAKQFGIEAIPTQVFLDKDGKEYFRHVGFFPEEELVKVLNQKGVK